MRLATGRTYISDQKLDSRHVDIHILLLLSQNIVLRATADLIRFLGDRVDSVAKNRADKDDCKVFDGHFVRVAVS